MCHINANILLTSVNDVDLDSTIFNIFIYTCIVKCIYTLVYIYTHTHNVNAHVVLIAAS